MDDVKRCSKCGILSLKSSFHKKTLSKDAYSRSVSPVYFKNKKNMILKLEVKEEIIIMKIKIKFKNILVIIKTK